MSEGRKGGGRTGGRPEAGPAGSVSGPRGGGLAFPMGWIVSANLLALVALVLAVVGLVFHFTDEGNGGGSAVLQPSPTAQPTATAQPTPTPAVVEVSVDDDPSWGPEDAPVTIVEFSDFL
jgi:protein-disulfide isomerase